jgi:anti-anti-sigma factor
MEITVKALDHAELITVKGRVDSVEAPRFAQALEAASRRGKPKLIVDIGELEYMSSAGFRALADAQRNYRRHDGGEVVLAQAPALVREALDLVGFAGYFMTFDTVKSALAYAEGFQAGGSVAGPAPTSPAD